MKRSFLTLVLLFGALGGWLSAADRPNFIFILADDLGWSDLGCYGSTFYETPNLDRLAKEGMRFTSAYAACNVCSPTRASILTGKYPARLHLTDWLPGRADRPDQKLNRPIIRPYLPLEEVTIAEALIPHCAPRTLSTRGRTSDRIAKRLTGISARTRKRSDGEALLQRELPFAGRIGASAAWS